MFTVLANSTPVRSLPNWRPPEVIAENVFLGDMLPEKVTIVMGAVVTGSLS